MTLGSERGTDWDEYSNAIAQRKNSPEWAVLRNAREQHYDQFFSVTANEMVLDAGCGHGEYTLFALKRGARVWSIDTSEAMLSFVRSTCQHERVSAEGYSLQSVTEIGFPDEHFDTVYCLSVLECLSDPEQAIAELVRVLKPGGRLYLDVCNAYAVHWRLLFLLMQLFGAAPRGHMRYFRPGEIRAMTAAHGCHTVADSGQAFSPPWSGIYTADLRRYTILPSWIIKPLDRLYLAVERLASRTWPIRYLCWHYFIEARKA